MKLSVRCIHCYAFSWPTSWRCLDKHNPSSLLYLASVSVPDLWSMSGNGRLFFPSAWSDSFTNHHPYPISSNSNIILIFFPFYLYPDVIYHPAIPDFWDFHKGIYIFLTQSDTPFAQWGAFHKSCHLWILFYLDAIMSLGGIGFLEWTSHYTFGRLVLTRNLSAVSNWLLNYFLLSITGYIQHCLYT